MKGREVEGKRNTIEGVKKGKEEKEEKERLRDRERKREVGGKKREERRRCLDGIG